MRVLQVHRSDDEPDDLQLDDIYITRDGRTALLRCYLSRKPDRWDEYSLEDNGPWDAPGVARITYNGVEHTHWFDRLSGLTAWG